MSDRLDRAWELRRDVLVWIGDHPGARMPDIAAAFERPLPTIRHAVTWLRAHGNVAKDGDSTGARYVVACAQMVDREQARDRLRDCGRKHGVTTLLASRLKRKLNEIDAERSKRESEQPYTGYYRNRPDRKLPYPQQRGQGAA